MDFLNSIGQSLRSNFHIKLDLVALYSADSAAAHELIRLASLLQSAAQVQAVTRPSGRSIAKSSMTCAQVAGNVGERADILTLEQQVPCESGIACHCGSACSNISTNLNLNNLPVQAAPEASAEELIPSLPVERISEIKRLASEVKTLSEALPSLLHEELVLRGERERSDAAPLLISRVSAHLEMLPW